MASSGEGQVISVHSVDEWKQHFQKGVESKKLVVVDFTASWCGPCRIMSPILADLSKKMPDVIFLKVDVDELKDVAEEWQVQAMPTFILFIGGKEVHKLVGAKKEDLHASVVEYAALAAHGTVAT